MPLIPGIYITVWGEFSNVREQGKPIEYTPKEWSKNARK
jgi:hypothetical protein